MYTLSVRYCSRLRVFVRESSHPLREIFLTRPRASPTLSATIVLTLTILRASIRRFILGTGPSCEGRPGTASFIAISFLPHESITTSLAILMPKQFRHQHSQVREF